MAYPDARLAPVSTTAGAWSVWLAVGSFVVLTLQTVWVLFILLPQWNLVDGDPDPAYIAQSNIGTVLFAGTALLLATAAIVFGARSIRRASPFPPDRRGRKAAIVRGWIGVSLGAVVAWFSIGAASIIW